MSTTMSKITTSIICAYMRMAYRHSRTRVKKYENNNKKKTCKTAEKKMELI